MADVEALVAAPTLEGEGGVDRRRRHVSLVAVERVGIPR